ncbi:MAG: TRAP transporter substrate-binding protein [Sulfuritalea sp.]|nr:TRAP transporter substrate-binding protein [Sulfuritalea sp.]
MKKQLAKTLIAASIAGAAFAAQSQEVTLKVHHFLSPTTFIQTGVFVPWCQKLAKESADKIKCQIYPAMQLGGTPPQLYDQAKDGVADIVWTVAGYSANRFPMSEVFELPFMMTNAEATSRAAWDFYQTYSKHEFKDTHILAVHVHGPGYLFTTKKQMTSMADFKGMKFRAPTRLTNKMLGMLGATPVGMPVPAVPEALSKGVIDGAVIPYQVVPSIKVNELVKYAAETDPKYNALYTTVFVVAMNKAKYESLPPDLKKVLDANSGLEFSASMGRIQEADDGPGRAKVKESGVTINTIPAAELDKWKKATDNLDDEWAANMTKLGHDGPKLLQAARDLIKKHTK